MDLSVNKSVKDHLKSSFQLWYASQIEKQLKDNPDSSLTPVDFCVSIIKPLHGEWLFDAYHYIKSRPEIVRNGFKAAGILDRLQLCEYGMQQCTIAFDLAIDFNKFV